MPTPAPDPQKERRRAPRALADFPIQLAPGAEAAPARLRDISEIGLACTSTQAIAEFQQVAVDLKLPGHAKAERVKGAVVRCEPVRGRKGEYDLAIYFTELAPTTRAALRAFVTKAKPAP